MCLKSRRGNVLFEFALAGIPIMLLIISVIEISRGMWTYTTLSYAVTEASRLAIVHGQGCGTNGNRCPITVNSIADQIWASSPELDPGQMNVTFSSTGGGTAITCNPLLSCTDGGDNPSSSAQFPPVPGNAPGVYVTVTATYPFQSPLTMFFPGLTSPTAPITTTLRATSQEPIQF
jgi:Flp pilus assembly protein TadG